MVELIAASTHGWPLLRVRTFNRDGGCIAVQRSWFGDDIATDECRGKGGWVMRWNDLFQMEWDHVTMNGVRYDDIAHGVTVCPWHHRGSRWRIDTAPRRQRIREVLRGLYPEAWAA